MSWEVDGVKVTDGVATDSAALRDGDHYKISSRLRVEAKQWLSQGRQFSCIVEFFNGVETIKVNDTIYRVKGRSKEVTRIFYCSEERIIYPH